MSVQSSKQSFPDASSPVHALSNPCCSDSGEDSSEGQESKPTCLVKSSSVRQCLGFEPEAGVSSSSDHDLLYETIESLQSMGCNKSQKKGFKMKRKMCRSDCNKNGSEMRRENVSGRRQACNCVASFAADCAAVCCCPCALLHIFILAFVKTPSICARKTFCFVKKKARSKRKLDQKKTNDDDSEDDNREKSRYYTPPWSCTESPERRSALDGSISPKLDSQNIWSEFYAAGRMGFGGLPFEWNKEP
ncbi:hypothetical protein SUGI_0289620 [Cryptomeria japonica]|uniref:uncharacterized protein LOC131033813 n=1 Tax=Cryptomeria japonica TaxID=3369 RepID=UPI00240892D0|nr:uncharacterized protein LOC131033813 [Cryptomeria japonica]GLJ16809.1 hypothetical protein SUGI_0289620 [Cryptomeria japonica]